MRVLTVVVGTTTNSYTIVNATQAQTGVYSLRIIDACKQQKSASFSVRIFPFVIQQEMPRVTKLFLGDVVTLSIVALGETNLQYQWHRDGQEINGATVPSITLEPFTWSMNGTHYTILVTDGAEELLSNPAVIVGQPAPVIGALTPSTTQALFLGQTVDFSVMIFVGESLAFTWLLNDEILATGNDLNPFTITITSLDLIDAEVRVNVSNPNGYVLSSSYPLAVQSPPSFIRPRPRTIMLLLQEVYTIDMSREVLGNNRTHQWLKNNETLPNETSVTLALPPYDMSVDT